MIHQKNRRQTMPSEQYLARALNIEMDIINGRTDKTNVKKLLALIDEFVENHYPKDSPSYRKGTITKEDFVHALIQAYLLGKRTNND